MRNKLKQLEKMKKEKTTKQLEKKLKFVKICLYICYFCFFTMTILFFSLVFINHKTAEILKQETNIELNITNVTINFTDLNEDEIIIAKRLILNMKDIYLSPQKSITFSHNISESYGNNYTNTIVAFNQNKGEIYILWRNNTIDVMVSLCHETLHTAIINNEASHKIIYDIAEYLTCFKEEEL